LTSVDLGLPMLFFLTIRLKVAVIPVRGFASLTLAMVNSVVPFVVKIEEAPVLITTDFT